MSGYISVRYIWRTGLVALALLILPTAALSQSGRITGKVTDQQLAPVYGAQVSVVGSRLGTLTNQSGQFVLTGVPAGTHQLRVTHTGYGEFVQQVSVASDRAANVEVQLEGTAIELGGVVVSASRRAQRVTDAPATITRIDAHVIGNSAGSSWTSALKDVKGLDFIQIGMTSVALNARGFNSSFNNRMLMMEDGRIAVLPENGLPIGQFTALPKVDLAGIEVLVGPGAALYGADASSGVVTLQSKDPRRFPGTTVEVTGGNRQYANVQARHAGVAKDWGYKVAGEWQQANDWDNVLPYTIAGVPNRGSVVIRENELGVHSIDWDASVARGTGALVRYFENGQLELSGGASQTNGVGQTNVGRNQLRDWQYNFMQARYSNQNWFLNAYRTQSQSGESYAINRYADAFVRNPTLTPDSLRKLSDWPSNGRLYAAEVQNNFQLPMLLSSHIVWGAQFRRDLISSDRQWLSDRLTGRDLQVDQKGVYGQSETPLAPWLNLVLAARYDQHENYDAQFSPKLGVVLKPTQDQSLRFTYNRAFKSPTTLQTDFYIPDWTPIIAIYGNTAGFQIKNAAGQTVATYDPLRPEENRTIELGYKGVLGQRMFLDVAAYRSQYENFLSPLVVIANPFAGAAATFAHNSRGERILNDNGVAPISLIYYNLGKATILGTDAGVNYYLTPRINLKGTFSWLKADSIEVPAGREEAASLNAPNTKWTAGADFTDVGSFLRGWGTFHGGFSVRHVGSYYFRSGINMGVIPTFSTADVSLGYTIPRYSSTLNLGISNLFTCTQSNDKPLAYDPADRLRREPTNRERECGFGMKHQEMINMPHIGTMIFLGLRYQGQWGLSK